MHAVVSIATLLLINTACWLQYIRELEENQTLFPYENLELGQVLGTGAFGIVRKAIAYNFQPDGSSVTVAIKMLKGSDSCLVSCS